jgi:hypothetical protein
MNGETCQGGAYGGEAGNEMSDSAAGSSSSSGTDDSGTNDGTCVATNCTNMCIPVYQRSCRMTDGGCGCMVVIGSPGPCQ